MLKQNSLNCDLFFTNLNDNITYVSLVLDNDNGVRATPQHDPAVRGGNNHGSSQSIILIMNKEKKIFRYKKCGMSANDIKHVKTKQPNYCCIGPVLFHNDSISILGLIKRS